MPHFVGYIELYVCVEGEGLRYAFITAGNSGNVIDFSLLMMYSFYKKSHGLYQFVTLYTTISHNQTDNIQRVMLRVLLIIPFFHSWPITNFIVNKKGLSFSV